MAAITQVLLGSFFVTTQAVFFATFFEKKGLCFAEGAKKLQNNVYWLMKNEKSKSFLVLFYKKEQESFRFHPA